MFSHFDADGHPRMVDVSQKPETARFAVAECIVRMQPQTMSAIEQGKLAKGDVLAVARLAAIQASKQTATLIPLCHSLPLESVEVSFDFVDLQTVRCRVSVRTTSRTGVEMEAMTAAAVAGLTVYDMCKGIDRQMEVGPIRLLEKAGGKSGHFVRNVG
jgi:cyclic pyranopterin monophosphate synthase